MLVLLPDFTTSGAQLVRIGIDTRRRLLLLLGHNLGTFRIWISSRDEMEGLRTLWIEVVFCTQIMPHYGRIKGHSEEDFEGGFSMEIIGSLLLLG